MGRSIDRKDSKPRGITYARKKEWSTLVSKACHKKYSKCGQIGMKYAVSVFFPWWRTVGS